MLRIDGREARWKQWGPVKRHLSVCKMVVAWSKVIEWKQWELVGFWLNSEGRINRVCWCMYLDVKDGGQAWLSWTTARMEIARINLSDRWGEQGMESRIWGNDKQSAFDISCCSSPASPWMLLNLGSPPIHLMSQVPISDFLLELC